MFAMSILFFIHTSMNNLKFIVSESLSFETVIYKQYDRLDSLPQLMSIDMFNFLNVVGIVLQNI